MRHLQTDRARRVQKIEVVANESFRNSCRWSTVSWRRASDWLRRRKEDSPGWTNSKRISEWSTRLSRQRPANAKWRYMVKLVREALGQDGAIEEGEAALIPNLQRRGNFELTRDDGAW